MTIYRISGRRRELKALTPETLYQSGTPGGLSTTLAYSASVWAYRCVQLRAQTIAGIPIDLKRLGGNELLSGLFGDTNSDLLARIESALLIWGVCYLEVTHARLGSAVGLRWLNPGAVMAYKTPRGIESYAYTPQTGGAGQVFSPDQIVYLQTFNPSDDLDGLAPLEVALTNVGVDKQIARYAQSFFQNGARIEGILNIPGARDDEIDAVETKWKSIFRGVGNWFKTLVFGAAEMTYAPISYAPEDLALETLSQEMRRSICAAFGVPPILAGAWEASNYATAKEQRQSFYTETILPELDFIEDELNRQFMARYYPDARLAFDTSEINALREDELTRNQALTTAVGGPWMLVNEARARVGLPPVPGGDVLLPAPGTVPLAADPASAEVMPEQFFRTPRSPFNY